MPYINHKHLPKVSQHLPYINLYIYIYSSRGFSIWTHRDSSPHLLAPAYEWNQLHGLLLHTQQALIYSLRRVIQHLWLEIWYLFHEGLEDSATSWALMPTHQNSAGLGPKIPKKGVYISYILHIFWVGNDEYKDISKFNNWSCEIVCLKMSPGNIFWIQCKRSMLEPRKTNHSQSANFYMMPRPHLNCRHFFETLPTLFLCCHAWMYEN